MYQTRFFFLVVVVAAIIIIADPCAGDSLPPLPLDMAQLKTALSQARGEGVAGGPWPRNIAYIQHVHDFRHDVFRSENKTCRLERKPTRIIPHAIAVAEILWAICPREHIVAFNELAADPEYSFIAEPVKARGAIFSSKQTELLIGYQPDLVFTVFYSGAAFREKLKQAHIPCFDLGYFGSIASIKEQVLLIGRVIGEEDNSKALVNTIDANVQQLRDRLPANRTPPRLLYYDNGGYIPGETSSFNSICQIINAVNVGTEKGIKSWAPIDHETLLSWDPDVIVVPEGSHLREQLNASKILAHAQAVKNRKIYEIPGIYLRVGSQYLVLSANLMAGFVYDTAF